MVAAAGTGALTVSHVLAERIGRPAEGVPQPVGGDLPQAGRALARDSRR